MPTFDERLKAQNKRLCEKQKALEKLFETVEITREKIKTANKEIAEIKDEISALETRILTETITQKGISVSELAAAIKAGSFIYEKPSDKSNDENCATYSTNSSEALVEKDVFLTDD